jgi:ketosteroid isomerase-like protein
MPTTPQDTEIRKSIDALVQALRAKDIDALMTHYAPDILTFDLNPPLQVRGVGYRKNFELWFSSVQGPIDYETRDLHIAASGDVAFCYSLNHVKSTRTNGEKADYWVRVTSGLQKLNGRWLITHEHVSMPVDMQTMKAAPDLQP